MMQGMNTPAPAPAVTPVRRGTAAIVGLGVALLGAAAAVSAVYARQDGDLDWSVYGVGLGATAVLLLATLAGSLGGDLEAKRAVTGFPGAVGAISAGVMLNVYFEDDDWVPWAVGGVILGISVVAYLLGRAGAPTVSAIAGLAVLYGKAVEEFIDVDDDQTLIVGGAIVVVFVVAVTAIGWVLPHRALIGVVVGAGGVVALLALIATTSFLQAFASEMATAFAEDGSPTPAAGPGDLENDIYIVLAYSAGLVLMWTLAAWATGSPGFRVLAVVHTAAIVPLSMTILAAEHPTWWGFGVGAAGALLLLLAIAAGARGRRRDTPPPSTERPPPFFDSPHPATPAEGTPAASPNPPPGKSDATVVAPQNAPPPPDPNERRPK